MKDPARDGSWRDEFTATIDATIVPPSSRGQLRLSQRAGETLRVVHIAPVNQMTQDLMIPYCGIEIQPNTAEPLIRLAGAPCVACLRVAPSPDLETPQVER